MKKSISIVIALLLLINVFAVSAFAAVPAGNAIALTLTSDKDSYAAGETAMITLSVEAIAGVPALCAGEIEVSYNDAIFAPAVDISATASFADYGCTLGDIIAGENIDAGGSFIRKGSGSFYPSDESAYGWNAGLHFCAAKNYQNVVAVDCTTGPKTFITFPIKINAGVADGTYTIGVNKATFEDSGEAYLIGDSSEIYGGEGSQFGVDDAETFACGTLTITVGEAGGSGSDDPAQSTITVENLGTKVRWATPEEDSRKDVLYVGFEGKVAGLTDVSTLSEIGFKFSTSDATLATSTSVKTFVIYDFTAEAANTYKFRSIVRRPLAKADIDGTNTFNIYAQAYVVVTGVATPITASNPISTTLQAEYQEGVANQMEDRFA